MKTQDYRVHRAQEHMVPLAEALPLATPLSLMVDPSNGCNFRCTFCPTGDGSLHRAQPRRATILKLDLFHKILADLDAFADPIQVLHLYKDGEPLTNPALAEMVGAAKACGRVRRVELTTNGALMTEERARDLVEAGLDGIRFSIYGLDDQAYQCTTGTGTRFEAILAAVQTFHRVKSALNPSLHMHCKMVDTGLSSEQQQRFHTLFAPLADSLHIDPAVGWAGVHGQDFPSTLADWARQRGLEPPPRRHACSEPFMKLAVNANGLVSPCCVDWAQDLIVGDVVRESLHAIWTGSRLRDLRMAHLTRQRSGIPSCASCGYVEVLPSYANFDGILDVLRERYAFCP